MTSARFALAALLATSLFACSATDDVVPVPAPAPDAATDLNADDPYRAVYTTEFDVPVAELWEAFTTNDGLLMWMAPVVDIDFRIGGLMRSSYVADATLGDPSTIESRILAYDSERMLALKAVTFPEGFPFEEAARPTWSVFYFEPLPGERSRLTAVGNGYTDEPKSQQMRSFFAASNAMVLDKLKAAMAARRLASGGDAEG